MAAVTEERIDKVTDLLWVGFYEEEFRGKKRGRFVITREQLKAALHVERLHASTIQALQDAALQKGLVIIDLDDLFPCIETKVARRYRRPPNDVFTRLLKDYDLGGAEEGEQDTNDDDDEEG